MTNHFLSPPQKRPEIFADLITRNNNPGTFVRIPQKVVGHFLAVPTLEGENIFAFVFSCPLGGRGKYFGVFLAVRTVVGENMLEVFFSCLHGGRGEHVGR